MKLDAPYTLVDFTAGVIDDLSVSDSLLPRNAVRKGMNVMFDRPRGSVTQRLGTTQLGTTVSAGNTITGLHNFRSSTTANHQLLASATTAIYNLSGGVWGATVSGLTTGLKTRFLTYLDAVVFLNGTDAPQSWTGTGAWLAGGGNLDVANMQRGRYAAVLNTRMQVTGVTANPDTVYESSLEASGAISWTSGNRNFRVNPNDGNGNITSIKSNGKLSLIFKERGMYRYDGNELQHIANIGTPSHESVVNDDNGITYFFGTGANGVGFYRTSAGYPSKISRFITRWTEAIAPSFYGDVSGLTNGQKIFWSVGSVSVNDITYSNAWYVWNIADETMELRNYQDRFRVFSSYIDGSGNLTVVGGDADGMVQTINSGNTDNGSAINSECEFGPLYFTTRGRTKVVNEIITYAEHFQGLKLHLKVGGGRYKEIGPINETEKIFSNIEKFRGKAFHLKITAVNSGTPFKLDGFEFNDLDDEGYGK